MKLKFHLSLSVTFNIILLLSICTVASTFQDIQLTGGPVNNHLIFSFASQTELFTMLLTNEIDLMCAPLTKTQYNEAIQNPDLQLAPIYMNDISGIDINNNQTIPTYSAWRSPTNYTEFRKAMEYSVDKDGLISGPNLSGFATRIDTPIPLPNMAYWAYIKQTEYNPAAAAATLDAAGFVQGSTPNPYYDPSQLWSAAYLRVYPKGHEKEGEDLDPLIGYARADIPARLEAANKLTEILRKLGVPVNLQQIHGLTPEILEGNFHFYTGGWDFGVERFPLHLRMYMSDKNYINFRDSEYDYWAERFLNATSLEMAREAALECQRVLLDRVASVWIWSSKSWEAYRKGWLNMINMRGGYGLNNQWGYLFTHHENYPTIDTLKVGLVKYAGQDFNPAYDPPNEVLESVFSHLIYVNPYIPNIPGQSPQGGDQPWLAKDWMYWVDRSNQAHIMFWIRSDVKWHDGTPFTVLDVNYTIQLLKSDPSLYYYPYVEHIKQTIVYDNYTIEIIYDNPSMWNLYYVGLYIYILPGHLPPQGITVGTGAWKYGPSIPIPDRIYLVANRDFWLTPLFGDIDLLYYWEPGEPPRRIYLKISLSDLVMLAKAYSSRGNPPTPNWEPGCDIAEPTCVVGLSDLVTLAKNYGRTWGEYDP